ncbi:MATE family efflux transporter [Erysipelothrix sp. HDW6C]|uniref:MATE family efflux transporter n=1 Tax=Erysipelothrix sp. HDW6C TaxID=2714930 RepID=UPI001F0D8591|nr:MATE family efflux transporter [Erysipelothrix sp. HDW6C]
MSIRRFFGSKSFYKHVVIIAIPLIFQQLISNSVNLMVNLMIGQLGDHALAGVATVNRFFLIATFGTSGVIGAAAVFMAQFYGADDHEGMKQTFRYTIWAATIIMSLFLVIGVMFPTQIIGFFVNDPNVIREGLNFIYIGSLAFIPNIVTLSIAGSMRATGDSKTPLAAGIVSVIVNAFFNYGLIYGNFGFPAMGVTGAAIGTLIARTAELVFISYFFIRGDYPFKTKIADMFTMSTDIIKRISSKALPLVSNEILWATGMALLLRFYASRGPEVISGYSIASTVSDMFFTMNAGMSIAITILVSQPLGAGNFDEARDNGYHLIGFGVILSAIFGYYCLLQPSLSLQSIRSLTRQCGPLRHS